MAKTDQLIIIDRIAVDEAKDELRIILELMPYSIELLFALRELTEEIATIVYKEMNEQTDNPNS